MGNRISSTQEIAARAKSDAIDRELDQEFKSLQKECKILWLVDRASRLLKQMKIIHQNGFSTEELMIYRPMMYRNTLDSAQAIVLAMRKIDLDYVHPLNRENADRILGWRIDSPHFVLTCEMAQAIYDLWQDPIIPAVLEYSSQYYLMDNATYFFTEVRRIGSENYLPTDDDVLRVRSTGITETWFNMDQLSLRMIDVSGLRSERKKWIHFFEGVTSIVFCAALSDYDQVWLGAKEQNRMEESLVLFESIINSRWFLRTSVILLLTKVDVLKDKLPKSPLETYFPEYTGGADINKAAKYILCQSLPPFSAHVKTDNTSPNLTEATDTSNIRLVFAAIKETILRNAFKDNGIL
ncbi:hypothetical protein SCLCIDRAFT_15658 [Scleroderma citrinum Foug A]|uniref:G protein alpha subunit n=1 Tax=Scleroderma citrinum Foug A TaxID=1036808 RepID=A0A0C3E3H1_9AGAM|nr:hypothetical protein SCLCIDRAFT_15658 [Scleroderma citrinum Foug A]